MFKKIIKSFLYLLFFLIVIFLVALVVKGQKGNPLLYQSLNSKSTEVGGPFESSGSTSRFALTEAIVEDNTFFLNEKRAKFSSPDVAESGGRYFSIFTPGVSFIGVPFYWVGKQFEIPQLATYISTVILALANIILVSKIAKKLGAGFYSSLLSGLMFMFATNALSYAFTFTQHHASTLIILMGILSALGKRTLNNNIWFGILYGAGLLMDIPNGIIMLPLVLYIIAKQFEIKDIGNKLEFEIKLNFVGLLIGLMPLIGLLGWYNYQTTGSYTKIAQFSGRSKDFTIGMKTEIPTTPEQKRLHLPFKTRNQLEGLYILLVSDQRSVFVYCPIVLIGILGFILVTRTKESKSNILLLSTVVFTNLLIYSMFGDPTGSWAFGPRYLIPATAVICSGIGVTLEKYKKKAWFIPLFLIISAYSIGVNVLGVMTTTQVPPKVEAVNFPNPIPYTYEYNWQLMIEKNLNSSLVYNTYLSNKLSSLDYSLIYTGFVFVLILILYVNSLCEKKEDNL